MQARSKLLAIIRRYRHYSHLLTDTHFSAAEKQAASIELNKIKGLFSEPLYLESQIIAEFYNKSCQNLLHIPLELALLVRKYLNDLNERDKNKSLYVVEAKINYTYAELILQLDDLIQLHYVNESLKCANQLRAFARRASGSIALHDEIHHMIRATTNLDSEARFMVLRNTYLFLHKAMTAEAFLRQTPVPAQPAGRQIRRAIACIIGASLIGAGLALPILAAGIITSLAVACCILLASLTMSMVGAHAVKDSLHSFFKPRVPCKALLSTARHLASPAKVEAAALPIAATGAI